MNPAVAKGWDLLQRGDAAAAEQAIAPLLMGGVSDEAAPLLGAIRLQQKRAEEAAALLARARVLAPREARFAFLHGLALAGLERLEDGVAAFREAIRLEPKASAPWLALADALTRLGRFDEAQATLRKLLRQEPENIQALTALAAAAIDAGDPESAIAPLRRALSLTAEPKVKAALHNNLAVALGAAGKHQEALDGLDAAERLLPAMANLDNRRIDILHQMGRFEDCVALYEKLLARDPGDSWSQSGLAASLLQMGRAQEAVAAFEAALRLPDPGADIHNGAAEAALAAGDIEKAQAFCEAGLKRAPFNQSCLALLGTSLRLKGDARDEALNGYDHLVAVYDLEPPDGFSRMEDFNAELAAHLDSTHPATREYLEQTLRGGTQTEGFLFSSANVLIRKLKARIDEAVVDYIAALPASDDHPFTARRRAHFDYAGAWSSRMTKSGFHVNHIHPKGWISSCYYVVMPGVAKDQTARQGWIKFGEPPMDLGLKDRRAIEPVPGRLVLFPSYMWHGTIAFEDDAVRTTIAFDAVPRG